MRLWVRTVQAKLLCGRPKQRTIPLEEALGLAGEVLGEEDVSSIRAAAEGVRVALHAEVQEVERLKQANEALDSATQELAAALVERALDEGL